MKNRTYGAGSSVSQKKQNKLSFQIKNDQIDNTDAVNERIMEKLPVPRLKMQVNSSDVQFLDGAGNTDISTEDENVAPKTGSVVWYFENLKSSKVHTKNDKIPIGKDPSLTEKALAKAFTFSQNVIQKKHNLKDTTRWSFQNNFNYE